MNTNFIQIPEVQREETDCNLYHNIIKFPHEKLEKYDSKRTKTICF
jgi:hypothetical protein